MEGVVSEVNDMLLRDPSLALSDPYGAGWLVAVNSPDAKTNFRNLLGETLARRWREEAAALSRLRDALAEIWRVPCKVLPEELNPEFAFHP